MLGAGFVPSFTLHLEPQKYVSLALHEACLGSLISHVRLEAKSKPDSKAMPFCLGLFNSFLVVLYTLLYLFATSYVHDHACP